jgi:hypothetical protein
MKRPKIPTTRRSTFQKRPEAAKGALISQIEADETDLIFKYFKSFKLSRGNSEFE